jgi:amino acid adenylation domain-containing protein/thioester reductase-like protein
MVKNKTFYPLTHPQKGIWYTEKFYPGTGIANVEGYIRLAKGLNFDILKKAINYHIANNDSLRIRICEFSTGPVQYVSDHFDREFRMVDFSNSEDSLKSFLDWLDVERRIPFQVNDSDLFEFVIFKLGEEDGGIFIKNHHTIADAWGMILSVNQINDYYFKLLEGKKVESYYSSYLDYIASEQLFEASEDFEANRKFWNKKFETLPELTTLRPNKKAFSSCEADRKSFVISRELTKRLNQYAEELSVSLFILFLSTLTICLQKLLDRNDIIIGTPLLNRPTIKEKTTPGMFIETIPVRLEVDDNFTFEEFILQVAQNWREMRNHRYPYSLLLEDIRKIHKLNSNLYDIMLSFQNAHFDLGLGFETFYSASGSEANSLCFHISDRDNVGELYIEIDYQIALFDDDEITTLYGYVFNLLNTALRNPNKKIVDISLVSDAEKEYLLKDLNNTILPYNDNTLIHTLFEEQVIKTPHNIAVEIGNEKLSYLELNHKANKLARILQSKGVKPGSIVALLLDRSCNLAISIWAILKAGGAYLPLDPNYPKDRINYILKDSGCTVVITNEFLQEKAIAFPCVLVLTGDTNEYTLEDTNLQVAQSSSGLAYVIYTSGSTGKPKGVMIEHKSVCNFFTAMARQVDLYNKRVLSVTTVCFDIFVFEFFYPLVNGNTIIIADENQQLVPMELSKLVLEKEINIIQTTPSRMQLLLLDESWQNSFSSLTDIILGGEAFPLTLLEKLRKITNARIINGYGPTEATVYATFKEITEDNKITIGKPLANTKVYILDKKQNLVPINVAGELYISGAGLARGYLNQEELTRERFIPSPFSENEKIYRTGDLAKWNNNGEIEFCGRADYQIKIRGYRIELGEIETILTEHKQIEEAVVLDLDYTNGDKYLCAYVKINGDLQVSDIRAFVGKELPDYMIPNAYVFVEEMPLNANGKIDRRQLLSISENIVSAKAVYAEPRNKVESVLAKEWSKFLNHDSIGIDDNFFDLGGDSLKIVRILVALVPYKWDLTARDFYKYQTIRKISEKITGLADTENEEDFIAEDITSIPDSCLSNIEFHPQSVNMENVLLTGATGFLGAHLLKDLLLSTDANIFCIIRGTSKINARERLKEVLGFYFPDQFTDDFDKRIKIVHGDITSEMWGLPVQQYNQLDEMIDTVFHTAAKVAHYGSYAEFKEINVTATQRLVDFCLSNNKMFHYISSITVSGKYLVRQNKETTFSEQDFFIGQHYYENVYVRSKFEAENLIFKAMHLGLRASIYRIGALAGRYSDGHFQINIKDNAMYNRIRSIILTEVIPREFIDLKLELTPVDYCSKAIVLLAGFKNSQNQIFHLFNNNIFTLRQLVKAAALCNYKITVKQGKSYEKHVEKIFLNPVKRDFLTGIINDVNLNKNVGVSDYPLIESKKTINYLNKLGFKWPKPNNQYLVKILKYMELTSFISKNTQTNLAKSEL